jgi:hypothetical protein
VIVEMRANPSRGLLRSYGLLDQRGSSVTVVARLLRIL